ncbi:hypothetical protein [Streptomyces albicerus]|uniref:hypothetical protein n=1 Tax=Streptomyces albicerus TaxID=2569859 RepID=UPI00124B6AEA|nr:hypothetical protein [Streptomyces albicerus]
MLEAVVAVVGTVVGVAGLATSYAGHRHSVREAARVALLTRSVEERERQLAKEAERRAEVVQASLVQVVMGSRPSPLAEQWVSHSIRATNGSDQPVRDVTLRYDGRPLPANLANGPLPAGRLLHAGESVSAALPASDVGPGPADPALGVVEFTDAAGVRWRRSTLGILERQYADGSWDAQPPNVAPFAQQQPGMPYLQPGQTSAPRRRKTLPRSVSALMILVGAVLVAWAVWSLAR